MNWGMPPILFKFIRFQLEDGYVKHAQLTVSVGAGQAAAEVHGVMLQSSLGSFSLAPPQAKTFLASCLLDFL